MNTRLPHRFTAPVPARVRPLRVSVLALLLCVAPYAQAEMYKWIDADGGLTYSNTPPPQPAQVKELTRIEDTSPQKDSTRTLPTQAPQRYIVGKPETLPSDPAAVQRQPETAAREPAAVPRDPESASRAPRGIQAEAARDPCLRSADPKCYERNKDRYHPYLGYSPTPVQPATPAIGASNPAGAGGSIGGAIIIRR